MTYDCLVVGAGFAGAVIAERLASQCDKNVLIVEKRNHIGGNSFDFKNEKGLFIQKYGPHIFHTNSKRVWDYLSCFTKWNSYEHRVLASVSDKLVSFPINISTLEKLYDRSFDSEQMKKFLDGKKIPCEKIENSRDVIVSQVGEELYNLFFKNYTKKQWGIYPEQLGPEVTKRLPIRFNRDTRYFSDSYQGLPEQGFSGLFEKLLSSPKIDICLNTDFQEVRDKYDYQCLVYTGPIDEFFDQKFGKLPYRSLEFRYQEHEKKEFQPAAVVNYPNDHDYTRVTEFKKLYLQESDKTVVCFEYPTESGDPYYPIPSYEPMETYEKYKIESQKLKDVFFIGRLAQYRYMNMDQVVEASLDLFDQLKGSF